MDCMINCSSKIILTANQPSIWQFIGSLSSLLNINHSSKINRKNNHRNNFNCQIHCNFLRSLVTIIPPKSTTRIILTAGIILTATKECVFHRCCR